MEKKIEKISKQVIVIRKDLNMRKGKMIAQGSHACLKAILDEFNVAPGFTYISSDGAVGEKIMSIHIKAESALNDWLLGRFTKICVSVNSESELLDVYNKAKEKGLICSLITDAGLTEFNGVPTITCCAIGPVWSDEVDEITAGLSLL